MTEHAVPATAAACDVVAARIAQRLDDLACMLRAAEFDRVPAATLPARESALLDHRAHMTAVVEAHHRQTVSVRVLQRHRSPRSYAREILLTLPGGRVVQYAVVDIALDRCPADVAGEILAERQPLGRVLQQLAAGLRVEPVGFIRASLPTALAAAFGVAPGTVAWGRCMRIHHGADCLIEGLELLAPP